MRNHPKEIEELMRDVADMNSHIQTKRERLDIIEAETHIEITTAKGEDGKPTFPNDTLRKAAFTNLIAANEEYAEMSQNLKTDERERLYTLAKIERLKLELRLFLLDREAVIKPVNA